MVDKTDFLAFYQHLGLKPGCSLEELKNAYRRRVGELHPDRRAGDTSPADAARLQELTAAYAAATTFHRRYGRLPGGHHTTARGPMPTPRSTVAAAPAPAPLSRRSKAQRSLLWLLLAGGLGWLAWSTLIDDSNGDAATPTQRAERRATNAAPEPEVHGLPALRIEIGTDAEMVRSLEGRPLMQNAQHWDYGPSWIEFSDGKVTDWYSSKLRPLKVATSRPLPVDPAAKPR